LAAIVSEVRDAERSAATEVVLTTAVVGSAATFAGVSTTSGGTARSGVVAAPVSVAVVVVVSVAAVVVTSVSVTVLTATGVRRDDTVLTAPSFGEAALEIGTAFGDESDWGDPAEISVPVGGGVPADGVVSVGDAAGCPVLGVVEGAALVVVDVDAVVVGSAGAGESAGVVAVAGAVAVPPAVESDELGTEGVCEAPAAWPEGAELSPGVDAATPELAPAVADASDVCTCGAVAPAAADAPRELDAECAPNDA
jgi:hypothetical protein